MCQPYNKSNTKNTTIDRGLKAYSMIPSPSPLQISTLITSSQSHQLQLGGAMALFFLMIILLCSFARSSYVWMVLVLCTPQEIYHAFRPLTCQIGRQGQSYTDGEAQEYIISYKRLRDDLPSNNNLWKKPAEDGTYEYDDACSIYSYSLLHLQ